MKLNETCEVKEISVNTKSVQLLENSFKEFPSKLHISGTLEKQAELSDLIMQFSNVFALEDEDLGFTDKVQHEIHVTDDVPVTQPYRRIPPLSTRKLESISVSFSRKG